MTPYWLLKRITQKSTNERAVLPARITCVADYCQVAVFNGPIFKSDWLGEFLASLKVGVNYL
jgi:hypothetical protein